MVSAYDVALDAIEHGYAAVILVCHDHVCVRRDRLRPEGRDALTNPCKIYRAAALVGYAGMAGRMRPCR